MSPGTPENVTRFRIALLERLATDPATLNEPGLSVVTDPWRADSAVCACYQIGAQTVLWCDPAVETQASAFVDSVDSDSSSPDAFLAWALANEHELLGSGAMNVLAQPVTHSADERVFAMRREVPEDHARILEFVAACDEDDVESADIDIEDLDPVIRAALADDGPALGAYASALPFDATPHWWDIGVLTHADHRRQGLGIACVRAVIDGIQQAGGEPLYRHELDNDASATLATKLGFARATHLHAIRFS